MAVVGSPFLGVWTKADNTLRLFQLAGDQFVQVGTNSVVHGGDVTEDVYLRWTHDGKFLTTLSKASLAAATGTWKTFDQLLQNIATLNAPATMGSVGQYATYSGWYAVRDYNYTFNGTQSTVGVNSDGTFTNVASPAAEPTIRVAKMSPADTFILCARTTNTGLRPVASHDANGYPAWGTERTLGTFITSVAAWAPDSRYLCLAVPALGTVQFWFTGVALASMYNAQDIAIPGTVKNIAISQDNRFYAISYIDGSSVYKTRIYQRLGIALKFLREISNFGVTLDWTYDTKYLFDAGGKKAMRYDGNLVFTAADSLVANLPASVTVSKVSPHVETPLNTVYIYDAALPLLCGGGFNKTNTKVALMNSTATFDPTATVASTVLSGKQVSGNGWPVGGQVLDNITYASVGTGTAVMKADKEKTNIIGGSITFQNLLVYDATTDKPLVFIALANPVVVEDTAVLGIDFASPGLLLFAL